MVKKNLLDCNPVSERIIIVRFNTKTGKITVVQYYAPINLASVEDKDDFYSTPNLSLKYIRK